MSVKEKEKEKKTENNIVRRVGRYTALYIRDTYDTAAVIYPCDVFI